jgi:hypothetical protein
VSAAEAQKFAAQMSSLFVETSVKTSVGVREAFQEVVEQIIDIPELWDDATNGPKDTSAVVVLLLSLLREGVAVDRFGAFITLDQSSGHSL